MITLNDLNFDRYDAECNNQIKQLLGSIIVDRWLLRNKQKLFYNESDKHTESIFKVLDEKKFTKFNPELMQFIQLEFDWWIVKEFFEKDKFSIELPINDSPKAKDITENVIAFFLWPLAKWRVIDDLLFLILKHLFNALWIRYCFETKTIWFWPKARRSYLRDSKWFKINFKATASTLEEVLNAEISQWFVNPEIWDPHRQFWYTHLLRQHAKFELTEWWKKVLINWKRYNVVAATRWQGKTYKACLIAARWLLDTRPWFWWRTYREIKYFVPNKEDVGTQVMEYLKSFIWDLANVKLPNKKKAFEFWKYEIKCNITWNVFKIISLFRFWKWWELGTASWEWLACDLAIIDEAARIPDDFWFSFHQRAWFETAEFYLSSTINEETPVDHWFYQMLIDGESGVPDISSHRITIDENEVMRRGKTEEQWKAQVDKIKSDLRKKSEKEFFCRMYCIILEESNVFNLTGTIINSRTDKYRDDDVRILWFDLWKLDDTAWLSLINLTNMEIESSIKVSNLTYWMQLQYAKEYKDKYSNLFVVWDRSWVWEAVSEQDTLWVVDVWIKSTGQWELNYNRKLNYYTANKWLIINSLATVFNSNLIKVPAHNVDLIDQLNNFVKMKSWRWEVILYKWKGKKKDDLVLSTAYAIFYMYAILKLKTKEELEEYVRMTCNTQTYWYNDISNNTNPSYYGSLY